MPKLRFEPAPDAFFIAKDIIEKLEWDHIDLTRVRFVRSKGAKTNAVARIWGLSRVFQEAFDIQPLYVIELTERFYKLPREEQEKTIIHELMHIPKNFSGALLPHKQFGKWKITERQVKSIHRKYKSSTADMYPSI